MNSDSDREKGVIDVRGARIDVLALVLGAAALFLVSLGARDLWNPNEPTYGRAVVEMSARGDWLVPTVNGGPFAEKPILYYWLALAFSKVSGGVSELSLRLPSVFTGVCAVSLTYLLVLPYAGRRRARMAGAMLATQYLVWWTSRSVQMDVLILASTVAVLLPLTRMIDFGFSPSKAWALAGMAAGLGFVAKGPVAWIIPGIVFVSFVSLRRLPPARWAIGIGWGASLAVAVAAPWYVALWMAGHGDLINEVLFRQNFSRFIEAWDHDKPWHYYLPYVFVDYLPWSLFVPVAIGLPWRAPGRRLDSLAWVWLISTVVFFSLADSKRAPYILPMAPSIAILASGVQQRFAAGTLSRKRQHACLMIVGLLAIVFGLLAVVLILDRERIHPAMASASVATGAGVAIAATILATALWTYRRQPRWQARTIVAGMATLYVSAALFALPAANVIKSARPWALRLEEIVGAQDNLVSYGFYRWRAGYSFYADRSIHNYLNLEELLEVWRDEDVYVLVEDNAVDEVRAALGDIEPVMEHRFADRIAYLFSSGSP